MTTIEVARALRVSKSWVLNRSGLDYWALKPGVEDGPDRGGAYRRYKRADVQALGERLHGPSFNLPASPGGAD